LEREFLDSTIEEYSYQNIIVRLIKAKPDLLKDPVIKARLIKNGYLKE